MAVSLEAPQSLNRYSYVSNMPLTYFDRTGLFKSCPPNSGPNIQNSDGTTSCGDAGPHVGGLNDAVPCKDYYINGFYMGSSCRSGDDIIIWRWDVADHVRFSDGTIGASKNRRDPNFFARQQCTSQYLSQKYGPGAQSLVDLFSLYSLLGSHPGPAWRTTVIVEGAKLGTVALVKAAAGTTEATVAGWAWILPTVVGTLQDVDARSACSAVSGANPPLGTNP